MGSRIAHIPTSLLVLLAGMLLSIPAIFVVHPGQSASLPMRAVIPMLAADSGGPPPTAAPFPLTATPTPRPAPSPTPTQPPSVTPGKVDAVHSTYYADSSGVVHVLGDVTNGLDTPVSFVEVTVNLTSGGTLVKSDATLAVLSTIPAGGISPFEDLLLPGTPSFDAVDVEVTDYHVTGAGDPPLITGLDVTIGTPTTDSAGVAPVPVTVRNDSSTSYPFVSLYLALYQSDGSMVLLSQTFSRPTTLAPGQSGTSEFLFLAGYTPQFSSWKTFVTAQPPS